MSITQLRSVSSTKQQIASIRLIIDKETGVQVGDRPVFGSQITIKENLSDMVGQILNPGLVIGWVDYVETKKFGCLTNQNEYIDASNYLCVDKNQIVVSQPIKLLEVHKDIKSSKQIFSFCKL